MQKNLFTNCEEVLLHFAGLGVHRGDLFISRKRQRFLSKRHFSIWSSDGPEV
jgi:hypothetical protein